MRLFASGELNGSDVIRVSRVLFVQRLSLSVIVPCGQQVELLRSLTSSDVSCPREETSMSRAEAFAREKSGRNDPPWRGARRIRKRAPYADLVLGGEAYDAVASTYRGSNCVVRTSIRGNGRETARRAAREGGVARRGGAAREARRNESLASVKVTG